MTIQLPFVGRGMEVARLKELHSQRRHVSILGPAGVGKSALIHHLASRLPVLDCPQSVRLSDICGALESQLGLSAADQRLVRRKNHLLRALAERGQTVVFDGLAWTTPKLGSFLECVSQRVPVWICARSEHPWDIGHFWTLLVRFERVELHPFRRAETHALVEAAVQRKLVPSDTRRIVAWLHRRSAGSPLVLRELLAELATGHYDLSNPLALRRLDLDRRIHEVLPVSGPL
jgi:hypothetical protein